MKRARTPVRAVALLAAVGGSGVGARALAEPWLREDAAGDGFTGLVGAGCALALLACWAWLALGTALVAAQALRPGTWTARWRLAWVPSAVRVVVPALVGAAVATAPAQAATEVGPAPEVSGPARMALAGLPLPDRVPTTRPPAPPSVVVQRGDSLWRIAARLLPDGAPDPAVDRTWRRIARLNAARVPDPDLIVPGTRLRVPALTAHPREEAS